MAWLGAAILSWLVPAPSHAAEVLVEDAAPYTGITFAAQAAPFGAGVSFVDVDGDHDLDIYLIDGNFRSNRLYLNEGGFVFTDVPLAWGTAGFIESRTGAWADYDNDGDKDLYLTTWNGPNRLYRNEGSGFMLDVTASAGMGGDSYASCGAAWGDVDNDGYLDLYVANRGWIGNEPNQLFRNNGDGTFTDMAPAWGVDSDALSFQPVFTDYDSDGDLDIYVANDRMSRNDLFRNDLPAGFTDVTEASGTGARINGMGNAPCDVNGDGITDFLVTNTRDGHVFFVSDGPEHWTDMAVEMNVAGYQSGWGAQFFDVDNDADEDLFLAHGAGIYYDWDTYNMLLINEGWGSPFTDMSDILGINDPENRSFGLAAGDLDGDGRVDFLATNIDAECEFYRNMTQSAGNWIQIIPVGEISNRDGIGARIEISAGGITQRREIRAGSSYLSQMGGWAHFGLGYATKIDQLLIYWPSGLVDSIENPGFNRILIVEEGGVAASVPIDWVREPRLQAAPNPFQGSLQLSAQVPPAARLGRLRVLDVRGRTILARVLEPGAQGRIEYTWDGRDASGRRVPAGAYLLELTGGGHRAAERVVALR